MNTEDKPSVICLYKPAGMTSHDAVSVIKRITGQKTGHTGTLDPGAEGVLPVLIGSATKLASMMTDSSKTYEVEVIFGTETDTQDETGIVTIRGNLESSEVDVRNAVASFLGLYSQIPPMYSALKVNGRKLYELARKGIEVQREPRLVTIYRLDILDMSLPDRIRLLVQCSKGTYMRTLCEDLGRRLNARAHMGRLIRTEAGGFSLNDAIPVEKVKEYADMGRLDELLIPVENIPVIKGLKKARIVPEAFKRLINGGVLKADDFESPVSACEGEVILVKTYENEPAALYVFSADIFKPKVML